MMAHGLVERQAGTGALLTQDPRFMSEFFEGGMTTSGKRMPGCTKHHEFIFDPALDFDVRVSAVAFNQT